MQMSTDDEIYAVDDYFLGPPKASLPWRVRYRAYGIGSALYALILGLEIWTGIIGFWPAVYGLLVAIGLTTAVMERVNHENTLKAVATSFVQEVTAPRGHTKGQAHTTLTLTGVRNRARHTS